MGDLYVHKGELKNQGTSLRGDMEQYKIIGIVVVKNEDIYVERAVRNIINFCDSIIIAENYSQDRTYEIVKTLADENSNIHLYRIKKLKEAHPLIEGFAGSKTWIFGVDGDEIYDPDGLTRMRQELHKGTFKEQWLLFGNVLNCTTIDFTRKTAKGYLAPPSRSMTKLFNFSLIESWVNCPFVLSGGTMTFKDGYHAKLCYHLGKEISWEDAYFRCLHTVFIKRSSLQKHTFFLNTRLNARETLQMKRLKSKGRLFNLLAKLKRNAKVVFRKDWKNQKYRRGPLLEKDVSAFFPE